MEEDTDNTTHTFVIEEMRRARRGRVLDAGTGEGVVAAQLARMGFDVHSCDIVKPRKSSKKNQIQKSKFERKYSVRKKPFRLSGSDRGLGAPGKHAPLYQGSKESLEERGRADSHHTEHHEHIFQDKVFPERRVFHVRKKGEGVSSRPHNAGAFLETATGAQRKQF